jgi:hypothetical protein
LSGHHGASWYRISIISPDISASYFKNEDFLEITGLDRFKEQLPQRMTASFV